MITRRRSFTAFRMTHDQEFDEVECCALANAFAKNPQAIATLLDAVDGKTLKLFADEMIRTEHIAFQRNETAELVYPQIAKTELKRIEAEKEIKFNCPHSAGEHETALKSVIKKLYKPVN
ncbi:MAG: hypothetical protein Q8P49_03925 [Candidatus Liptonbacteria bacterium]|nr:hypothetical protein [Candidatus Liptonbacteria bacterium]